MSRSDNCYDNAFMESCFGTCKNELELKDFENVPIARTAIKEYIGYYNVQRRHSALRYLTPVEFEALNNPNLRLDAARDERSRGTVVLQALRASSAPQTPALS